MKRARGWRKGKKEGQKGEGRRRNGKGKEDYKINRKEEKGGKRSTSVYVLDFLLAMVM